MHTFCSPSYICITYTSFTTPTTHPLHVHILTYRHLTHVVHTHFPWPHRYSNIFVTSPSPENLRTLFEFVFKGFDALRYSEHEDYELVQSTNPEFNKAIVRVNIFHDHRQTIQVCMCLLWEEGGLCVSEGLRLYQQVLPLQYIHPGDSHKLEQAELVCIDEAAAIPLPLVKNLLGPYLVFMASTVNGYV